MQDLYSNDYDPKKDPLFLDVSRFFKDGQLCITEEGYRDIAHLVDIVIYQKYFLNLRDRDELRSVGYLKCLSLLNKGDFTQTRGKLYSYLWSGVRNEIHNYLHHCAKLLPVEDITSAKEGQSYYIEEENTSYVLEIPLDSITTIIQRIPFYSAKQKAHLLQCVINALSSNDIYVLDNTIQPNNIPYNFRDVAVVKAMVIHEFMRSKRN